MQTVATKYVAKNAFVFSDGMFPRIDIVRPIIRMKKKLEIKQKKEQRKFPKEDIVHDACVNNWSFPFQ